MIEEKIAEWKIDFVRYCKAQKKSESTIRVYWGSIECFVRHFNTVSLDRIHWKKIADYILQYDSARTMDQKKYSIQLFYGVCFGQWKKMEHMPSPKRDTIIPQILNVDEVSRILLSIKNLKQRCAIQLAYDCALRISEVTNAKIKHIDFDSGFLFIDQSKGAKDRAVPFTPETKNVLLQYLANRFPNGYTGEEYLFDGQDNADGEKRDQYSQGSLRAVLKRAVKKSGILKKIKFHSLRHSKATHWHNSGVMSLKDIADLLGHNNTKTTEVYLHTQDEDLRDKAMIASKIIATKMTSSSLQHNLQEPKPKIIITKSEKEYHILLNGKTYVLKEANKKITEAASSHNWTVGKESSMVLDWYKKKGYQVKEI